jgi:hypothetical protein
MHPETWHWIVAGVVVILGLLAARKRYIRHRKEERAQLLAQLRAELAPKKGKGAAAANGAPDAEAPDEPTIPIAADKPAAAKTGKPKELIEKWLSWAAFGVLLLGIAGSIALGHRNLVKQNLILRDLRHVMVKVGDLPNQVKGLIPPPPVQPAAQTVSPAPKPDKCAQCDAQTVTEDGIQLLWKMAGDWAFFEGKCVGADFCGDCQPAAPKRDAHPTPSCHKKP